MDCAYIYRDYLNCGIDEILLLVGLTPATEYSVLIQNKAAKYVNDYTTDADGNFTIPATDFPNGLFNPYAGPFLLSINSGCDDTIFCEYYKYIQFEVVNGNGSKNTLTCCPPDVVPADITQDYLIPE